MKPILRILIVLSALSCLVRAGNEKNISELPKHIKPPESGIALIADYNHATSDGIPVYLVNRSGNDLQPDAQDGDPYLKLEYQDSNGHWKRAQPHYDSWCGNSYMNPPVLHNDSFILLLGYQPKQGGRAIIQFRLYRQKFELVSNVGKGLFCQEDVENAQTDPIGIMSADFTLIASIARGDLPHHLPAQEAKSRRMFAMDILGAGFFERWRAEEVLRGIVISQETHYAKYAQEQLGKLKSQSEHPR